MATTVQRAARLYEQGCPVEILDAATERLLVQGTITGFRMVGESYAMLMIDGVQDFCMANARHEIYGKPSLLDCAECGRLCPEGYTWMDGTPCCARCAAANVTYLDYAGGC